MEPRTRTELGDETGLGLGGSGQDGRPPGRMRYGPPGRILSVR